MQPISDETKNQMPAKPIPVIVFGTKGRIAKSLAATITNTEGMELHAKIPAKNVSVRAISDHLMASPKETVVCDFTHPDSLLALLQAMETVPRKLVTGTSGLTRKLEEQLHSYSIKQAVMHGKNFSIGAILASKMIEALATLTQHDPIWQAAVLDFHHQKKLDTESSTAKEWATKWSSLNDKTAPISAIRLGDGISEHSFIAAGCGERLEINHKILSHDAPMRGASAAIRFVSARTSGLFTPSNILDEQLHENSSTEQS